MAQSVTSGLDGLVIVVLNWFNNRIADPFLILWPHLSTAGLEGYNERNGRPRVGKRLAYWKRLLHIGSVWGTRGLQWKEAGPEGYNEGNGGSSIGQLAVKSIWQWESAAEAMWQWVSAVPNGSRATMKGMAGPELAKDMCMGWNERNGRPRTGDHLQWESAAEGMWQWVGAAEVLEGYNERNSGPRRGPTIWQRESAAEVLGGPTAFLFKMQEEKEKVHTRGGPRRHPALAKARHGRRKTTRVKTISPYFQFSLGFGWVSLRSTLSTTSFSSITKKPNSKTLQVPF